MIRPTIRPTLEKLKKYCAYQERSHEEVRTKLLALKVYGDDLEEIIALLIEEDFLNEERFARSFARGKFRMVGWGKQKIVQALKAKKISPYCIKKALDEIDPDEYRKRINDILLKKLNLTEERENKTELKVRLFRYLYQKGFEKEVIEEAFRFNNL